MIGYRLSLAELEKLIETHAAGWLGRAAIRTERFRDLGEYDEPSSIWSEVKVVYMQLQGDSKCAYCERKLESIDLGRGEQDVEHFRPKGRVRRWAVPKTLSKQRVAFTTTPADDKGYYLLPYHPFNYAAACRPCNSALKKDYFPVSGKYNLRGDDPTQMTQERPLLIYPLGGFDDAPEELIGFHGISPFAVINRGYRRHRALVTIEFFKLDDEAKRKNLMRERAAVIIALFPQLEKLANGAKGAAKRDARDVVEGFTSSYSSHSNCARSYTELFQKNRADAKALFDGALRLMRSIS
jgi:hypothetical protein